MVSEDPRTAEALQEQVAGFVRAFGLHQPDRTPCGQPVPVSEAFALRELAAEEELGQLELGRRLRLEKSTVSRLVSNLVGRGWLQRLTDPADGRAARLALTAQGRAAAADLAAARAARFSALLEAIPEGERGQVIEAFTILQRALREMS